MFFTETKIKKGKHPIFFFFFHSMLVLIAEPYLETCKVIAMVIQLAFLKSLYFHYFIVSFLLVQLLSCVQLFVTPWTAARQASLSFTVSWSLLKLMSIESVMPSNHLILCCSLFFLPSIFSSIRIFSNESTLCIRCLSTGASTAVRDLKMQDEF